jgi:hypothetical protein
MLFLKKKENLLVPLLKHPMIRLLDILNPYLDGKKGQYWTFQYLYLFLKNKICFYFSCWCIPW